MIAALIIRETRTRFGEARLGYSWALLEPVLHIAMLSLVFSVVMRGRPPIGTEFFIFYYTGLIPYHMLVHTSSAMTLAITSNASRMRMVLGRAAANSPFSRNGGAYLSSASTAFRLAAACCASSKRCSQALRNAFRTSFFCATSSRALSARPPSANSRPSNSLGICPD